MPYKKRAVKKPKATKRKYTKKTSAKSVTAIVKRILNKQLETKSALSTTTDYQQIGHNSFISLAAGDLLATTQGTADPNTSVLGCRIGDQINLKRVNISMMLELNERYSDVTYRIFVVKSAKDDALSPGFFFTGLSGNKMLDRVDKERYTVLYEKWGKIKNDTQGGGRNVAEDSTITVPATGLYIASGAGFQFSRITKIVKFNLPGKLFGKNGLIQYENGSSQVKMNDYHILIYAYSNYTTSALLGYNVLAVNECIKELHFTDG